MKKELPGLKYIGLVCNAAVNGGKAIPLYEPKEPEDGRLSINTIEGWNAAADAQHRRNIERGYPY